ncbi:hypothetical protein FKZ61_005975 [Litorilinea aerophila]|uniref:Uncharacterized protein n=1 Tax=Litorilinea aerophila TaxID=1204385 RepID=A0A540VJ47_9CHLR|nr:hypothetical protein [Litorilinea aerophila]MCC9075660.1 hypothetical protein [Litorilinea aerophila]OUC05429.1 hypothetical protein RY27_27350 [Litorilinea aerophila]
MKKIRACFDFVSSLVHLLGKCAMNGSMKPSKVTGKGARLWGYRLLVCVAVLMALLGVVVPTISRIAHAAPSITNAFVFRLSQNADVLVGSANVDGAVKPVVWRIATPSSLSPGFHWLASVASPQVLGTGLADKPYGIALGLTADGQIACGYASVRADAASGDAAVYWDLSAGTPSGVLLPGHSSGGNVAYACAKRGSDVYIVGRTTPEFPKATIWRNGAVWYQYQQLYGIFHDITPDAAFASAQLGYRAYIFDLSPRMGAIWLGDLQMPIEGAYSSRIAPDGSAAAFSDTNSPPPRSKVWLSGSTYSVNMAVNHVQAINGVVYAYGADSTPRAVRWRSDTNTLEDLNQVFASLLPDGVVLKSVSAMTPDGRYLVGTAFNPQTGSDEPYIIVTSPAGVHRLYLPLVIRER